MGRRAALVASLVFAVLCLRPAQAADRGTFDPDTCWQDSGGKIIVRLISGKAFAFEPTYFAIRVKWDPVEGPDLPPEGCPGNPLVARSIEFPSLATAEIALGDPTFPAPERLRIYGHYGPVNLQKSYIRLLGAFRRQYGREHCEILPDELLVCRACSAVPGHPGTCFLQAGQFTPPTGGYDRVPAKYQALPGTYFEHDGLPFAGECSQPIAFRGDKPRECSFGYALEDGISVSYRVLDWKVPETTFIAYDRRIRELVVSRRAPEYDATPEEMEPFQ